MRRKILAGMISLCLLAGVLPASALAETSAPVVEEISQADPEETEDSTLCKHHLKHTLECGYYDAVEESTCSHKHTENCYKKVKKCVHHHTAECYGKEEPTTTESAESTEAVSTETESTIVSESTTENGTGSGVDTTVQDESKNDQNGSDDTQGSVSQESKDAATFDTSNSEGPEVEEGQQGSSEDDAQTENSVSLFTLEKTKTVTEGTTTEATTTKAAEDDAPFCTHECSEETGCITKEAICVHATGEHDETCDFFEREESTQTQEETKAGGVCHFVCKICPLQKRIDALPDQEEWEKLTAEEQEARYEELYDEIAGILEAIDELTEEEQAELDRTRLDWLIETMGDVETVARAVAKAKTSEEWIEKYTIDSVSPSNATINLFDYWLDERDTPDNSNTAGGFTGVAAHWPRRAFLGENSINRITDTDTIHPLIFAGIAQSNSWRFGVEGFTSNKDDPGHTPQRYNTYVNRNNGAFQGIVQSTLDKDGYPVLNLDRDQVEDAFKTLDQNNPNYSKSEIDDLAIGYEKESLAYLFNPETKQTGKASYTDVKGLLKRDENGYYRYDSAKNFAEFDTESNQFYLFNKPGTTAYDNAKGQFFPFNSVADFLKEDGGELVQKTGAQLQSGFLNPVVNHYFGLTLDVDFYQPDGGLIEMQNSNSSSQKEDMVFTFSGDDDVWVFIDGVLVADLGGIHDTIGFTINFATGKVEYTNKNTDTDNVKIEDTSLREMFLKAIEDNNGSITDSQKNTITKDNIDRYFRKTGGDNSKQGTFRSGTEHRLQFYYLERGNQQSNLSLSYNLVPPIADDIVKVDQDNEPVKGATFKLYPADEEYNIRRGPEVAEFTTGDDGTWTMLDENDIPYDFSEYKEKYGRKYYVLREVSTPKGYRTVPDIHLEFNDEYDILEVTNTWDTGAVGNFTAKIYQIGNSLVEATATSTEAKNIPNEVAQKGLVVAVPLVKLGAGSQEDTANWSPIYGSNLEGFSTIPAEDKDPNNTENDPQLAMRWRVLKAALYQIYGSQTGKADDKEKYQSWHLEWSKEEARFQGTLYDLPGTPERYYHDKEDTTADLAMAYYYVDASVFAGLTPSGSELSDAEKLKGLRNWISQKLGGSTTYTEEELDQAIEAVIKDLKYKESFKQVNTEVDFRRLYGSHIYIPNILHAFSVRKLDDTGKVLSGAKFALYTDKECKHEIVRGTTDSEGKIIFSATKPDKLQGKSGYVYIELEPNGTSDPQGNPQPSYYLKEISAPGGFEINQVITPIYVTDAGVYADAGGANDGVVVYSGLGKLVGTMHRYATSDGVNVTLRDMKLVAGEHAAAENGATTLNVHYGLEGAYMSYGTHEGIAAAFITDVGRAYGMAYQNYEAHSADEYTTTAKKENLGDRELSHLFTGNTTIVVRDMKTPDPNDTGDLSVTKVVNDKKGDHDPTRKFTFSIVVQGAGNHSYHATLSSPSSSEPQVVQTEDMIVTFTGKQDQEGVLNVELQEGQTLIIKGLEAGAKYQVTETGSSGYSVSYRGNTGVIKAGSKAEVIVTNTREPDAPPEEETETTPPDTPVKTSIPPDSKTGTLTVSKTVTGSAADTRQSFPFTVTLTDTGINGTYGDMQFTNGVANFWLKHGESVTATGLPANIGYAVAETDQAGYTLNASGETGIIEGGKASVALFVNQKNSATSTGDNANLVLWLGLMVASGAVIVALIASWQMRKAKPKRRKKKK
ncbi:MAG: hypothetical protein Q4C65_04530 [Eubacteriales bacterium]|nr:hypothetical protein [Eubacteriales bacterium]